MWGSESSSQKNKNVEINRQFLRVGHFAIEPEMRKHDGAPMSSTNHCPRPVFDILKLSKVQRYRFQVLAFQVLPFGQKSVLQLLPQFFGKILRLLVF